MPDNNKNHLHDGHRKRKKKQFLESGIDHLPEHEPLEFLLYYAIPRKDTNYTAHLLIKQFGSFTGVLNADYDELMTVEGVTANAASLICLAKKLALLYVKKQALQQLEELYNSDRLKDFCSALFTDAREEEFHCLYLTDNLRLIAHEKIYTGKLGEVAIPIRKITRSIIEKNCSRLVITHNHPAGTCIPSRADVDSTKTIRDIFSKLEVELVDHVIVGRDGVTSMREKGFF